MLCTGNRGGKESRAEEKEKEDEEVVTPDFEVSEEDEKEEVKMIIPRWFAALTKAIRAKAKGSGLKNCVFVVKHASPLKALFILVKRGDFSLLEAFDLVLLPALIAVPRMHEVEGDPASLVARLAACEMSPSLWAALLRETSNPLRATVLMIKHLKMDDNLENRKRGRSPGAEIQRIPKKPKANQANSFKLTLEDLFGSKKKVDSSDDDSGSPADDGAASRYEIARARKRSKFISNVSGGVANPKAALRLTAAKRRTNGRSVFKAPRSGGDPGDRAAAERAQLRVKQRELAQRLEQLEKIAKQNRYHIKSHPSYSLEPPSPSRGNAARRRKKRARFPRSAKPLRLPPLKFSCRRAVRPVHTFVGQGYHRSATVCRHHSKPGGCRLFQQGRCNFYHPGEQSPPQFLY